MKEFSKIFRMKIKLLKSEIKEHILQCIGIFIALALLIKTGDLLNEKLLIAPFGASCIILFGFPESHFSNPRNIIGGYFISSLVGVTIYTFLGSNSWETALAVSLAVLIMLLTDLLHPPAGAVTIIAITTGSGWRFILVPVVLGAFVVVIIAVLFNKVHNDLKYSIKSWRALEYGKRKYKTGSKQVGEG